MKARRHSPFYALITMLAKFRSKNLFIAVYEYGIIFLTNEINGIQLNGNKIFLISYFDAEFYLHFIRCF